MRLLCVVLVLAGCGNSAPSCKDAVEKAAKTIGEGDPALVKEMTAECERSGWTGAQRTCLANAKDEPSAATCLAGVEISAAAKAKEAELGAKKAELEAQEAMKRAQEAQDDMQKVEKDLDDLSNRLTKAVDDVVNAQNDADRAAAKAKLEALQKEKADIETRIAAAKAAAAKAERAKGVKVSKECLDNPLAKGCQ